MSIVHAPVQDCEEHLLYFKRSLKVSAAYRAQHPVQSSYLIQVWPLLELSIFLNCE